MPDLMRELTHPDHANLQLTSVLHALSDPVRLSVVRQLASSGELNCSGLPGVGVSPSTLTHHMRVLREAGVTRTRIAGRERHISLRVDDLNTRFPGLLDAVLAGAAARTSADRAASESTARPVRSGARPGTE